MKPLIDEIEAAALKVIMIDNDDLIGLASLHTHYQTIASFASETSCGDTDGMKCVKQAADRIADLIEKIILDEVDEIKPAICLIEETTKTIQQLVDCLSQNRSVSHIRFPDKLAITLNESLSETSSNNLCIQLPDNVDEDIFREFLANIPHEIDSLESAILAGEKNPSVENANTIKGLLHNMKGESALMGLNEFAAVCHEAESLIIETPNTFPGEKLLEHKDWMQNAVNRLIGSQQTVDSENKKHQKSSEAVQPPALNEVSDGTAGTEVHEDMLIAESDVPLVMDFVSESYEHLEHAEADLLDIEEAPEDPERINAIFRAFHTIKGVAGFLNLKQIGALAHATENLLDLARKGNLVLSGTNIDVVFESIDVMKRMMGGLRTGVEQNSVIKPYPLLNELISRIKSCAAGEAPVKRLGEVLIEQNNINADSVRNALKFQRESEQPSKLGDVLVESGIATREQIDQAVIIQNQMKVDQQAAVKSNAAGNGARSPQKTGTESTVKVTTERLDAMINMVGELVIAQSMVSQDLGDMVKSNQRLERNTRHLEKITRDLQELSMSMRMVPVQGVFQKMARLVRDLSRKAEKEIDFQIIGAETELDRNVVEAIADPLVHMIRNSVDHGIELPGDRIQNGKPGTGRISLKACHKGGNIVIQITDDGRGLNKEKILKKALASGIIKEGADLSDQDIYRLIFHAGLSTAEQVTSISGRGVGMDVVRKNIESLRGRIDIDSKLGEGTTFTIYLPLTLAVIDGQEVTVGKEHYIIPIISIEQNFRPAQTQLSTAQGGRGEMIMVRGELLPLIRLHRIFNVTPEHTDPCESLVVIVSDGEQRCGVQVDSLLGQQQVVIKSLGTYLGSIQGISGGAIMGNGNVSLILDVPGLIQLSHKCSRSTEVEAA